MLTHRARWLILIALCGAALGVLRDQPQAMLLSLTVLIWVFLEWLLFRWRCDIELRYLTCTRSVNGSTRSQRTLWVGRSADVVLKFVATRSIRLPLLRTEDVLPENANSDSQQIDLAISGKVPVELRYSFTPIAAGHLTLPGVSLRVLDLHGLFYVERFIPVRQQFRVLPSFREVDNHLPTVKRINAVPPPGIHRLPHAGMGSELLELREYVPGDPPKSIAWKVSARRDQLLTRQYEAEVPVRTHLFLDASFGTRIGRFGERPIDSMLFFAASIARSALSAKDPVGLTTLTNEHSSTLRPGIGERHFYRLLNELASAADLTVPPRTRLSEPLIDLAYCTAVERYSLFLDRRVNRSPFTIFPILPVARWRWHRRWRLVNLLVELYEQDAIAAKVGSGNENSLLQSVELMHDDLRFATLLQKFLNDEGFAWRSPLVENLGNELHQWDRKFEVLTEALRRAVGRARDNELYVLLFDLIDCDGQIGELKRAVQLARAHHHRVAVLCPLPSFMINSQASQPLDYTGEINDMIRRGEILRLEKSATELRRQLIRMGVSVSFARDHRAVQLALSELNLIRSGRTSAT